jgi:hypothetical protein
MVSTFLLDVIMPVIVAGRTFCSAAGMLLVGWDADAVFFAEWDACCCWVLF